MKFLFPSAVIRRRASDRGPRPEAIRSWRWVFLSAMLLAAATFGALSVGAVQAQASAVSFCNGDRSVNSYGFSLDENTESNTVVGTVAACEPHGDSLTYSVGGTDVAKFNEVFDLNASTGEITVKSGASPNYEAYNSYSLTVTVTDAEDSSEATVPMSITVRNVDEPGIVTLSTSYPQVGVQVRASLYDPDGLIGGVFRSMWSRANVATGPFFLTREEFQRNNRNLYFTPNVDNRYRYLKFTIYYLDQTCPDVYSHTYVDRHGQPCLKKAEVVSENLVANADGLIIQQQSTNAPATGNVRITTHGEMRVGRSLHGDVLNVQDEDGTQSLRGHLTKFSWQWFRIDPRTLAEERVRHPEYPTWNWTYVVQDADRGKGIQARVSFLDDRGTTETLRSEIQLIPAPPDNAATGSPVITGTAQVGETLTADTDDIQDTDGIVTSTLIYQWFANDGTENTANESATSSTYTPVTDDEGKTITVQVAFSDEFGYTEALTSAPTASVAPRDTPSQRSQQQNGPGITGTTPTITGSPALSEAGSDDEWTPGEAVQVTLTFSEEVNVDTTDGTPSIGIQLSGTLDHNASYANGSGTTKLVFSYTLADDDGSHSSMLVPGDSLTLNGGTITSASSGGDAALGHNGAARASFVAAAIPNSAATGAPAISGTAQVGQTLTASTSDISDSDGLADAIFTYQWIANDGTEDTDIQDATVSTYTLTAADEGKTIKVRVSFTDDGGDQETRTSAVTVAVAAIPNSAATGAPTISGTAQVGQTLTASTSDISDSNGLANAIFTYQWIANDGTENTDIQNATGSTYILATADEGKTIKVRVSFTDDGGNQETLTSAVTVAVAAIPNSAATGAPTISGTAQVGQTLTASTSGISDSNGLANAIFTYQWIANDGTEDTDIQNATGSTYTVGADDKGKTIKVRVSFTDDGGNQETLTSAVTIAVAAIPNSAATGAPTISGTAQVGQALTASTSDISDSNGLANATFTYQWLADDTDITDATGSTYTLAAADEGKTIKVRLSFTDDSGHQETLTSAATVAVASAPTTLTAATHDAPDSHNGQEKFTFELRFSEELGTGFSYKTLRDHAFTVTRGEVVGARRLDSDSDTPNIRWEISVTPDSTADVTVELPVTTDCEAQGAICTEDGTMLSSPLKFTVMGPPMTASFESVPTSHNGSGEFRFRIAFSEAPKSGFSYTTMRDHAFTVTGGSVTGARRLVSGKNLRWEITVQPSGNADVTVVLPATTNCAAQGAICADVDKKLSNRLDRTVSGPAQ